MRSHEQVDAGDRISIKLASGRLTAQVDDSSPDPQSRDLGDGPRQNTDDSTSKE